MTRLIRSTTVSGYLTGLPLWRRAILKCRAISLCLALLVMLFALPSPSSNANVFSDLVALKKATKIANVADSEAALANRVRNRAERAAKLFTSVSKEAKVAARGAFIERDEDVLYVILAGAASEEAISLIDSDWIDKLVKKVEASFGPKSGERIGLYFDYATIEPIKQKLADLEQHFNLNLTGLEHTPAPLWRPAGSNDWFIYVRGGLVVPLGPTGISDGLLWLISQEVSGNDIKVLSLFSQEDFGPLERLRSAAGDRFVNLASADWSSKISGAKVIMAVGHAEGRSFVLRGADDRLIGRVPFAELQAKADANNAILLLAGCKTFKASGLAGFSKDVRDTEISAGISRALEGKTYGDVIAALGTPDNPFIIDQEQLNPIFGHVDADLKQLSREKVNAQKFGILTLTMIYNTHKVEYYIRAIAFLFVLYFLGTMPALLMPTDSRGSYNQLFPVLPNPQLHPIKYVLFRGTKELIFIVCVPIIGLMLYFYFAMCMLLLGFGMNRGGRLYYLFWLFLLAPIFLLKRVRTFISSLPFNGASV